MIRWTASYYQHGLGDTLGLRLADTACVRANRAIARQELRLATAYRRLSEAIQRSAAAAKTEAGGAGCWQSIRMACSHALISHGAWTP